MSALSRLALRLPVVTRMALGPRGASAGAQVLALGRATLAARPSGARGLLLGAPLARKRLRMLEEDVQRAPADVSRVLALYDAANRAKEHALVVRSFESAEYASDERTAKEYVKALSALGRLDRLDLAELAHAVGAGASAGEGAYGGGGGSGGSARAMMGEADAVRALGGGALRSSRGGTAGMLRGGGSGGQGGVGGSGASAEAPIHVVLTEPWRAQFWRLARNLGVAAAIMFMITMVRLRLRLRAVLRRSSERERRGRGTARQRRRGGCRGPGRAALPPQCRPLSRSVPLAARRPPAERSSRTRAA